MTERYVAASWWRMAVAVVALLLLPLFLAATLAAFGFGVFLGLHGFLGAGGVGIGLSGLVVLVVALMLTRLCIWARRGRKLMVRRQRIVLGLFTATVIASAVGWYLSGIWPGFPKAYWSVTGVYALLGLWLAVDAWEDRWSV